MVDVILASLWGNLFVFAPILSLGLVGLAFKLYWPGIAGWIGEVRVKQVLSALPSGRYEVLHDLLLPCSDGVTTQIDHLVIGPGGIYVIETKNYAGWIFGRADDAEWTQSFNKWSRYTFQNPLKQNYRHVKAVEQALGHPVAIHNVVVFLCGSFPNGRPDGVLSPSELAALIRGGEKDAVGLDTKTVLRSMFAAVIVDPNARRQHVRALMDKHGGRWRLPVAHVLVTLGVLLFLISPALRSHQERTRGPIGHPINQPEARPAPQAVIRDSEPSSRRPLQIPQQHHVVPIQIVAASQGEVSVMEDGHLYTLHVGDETPLGWKLVAASTHDADMIRPDGLPFHSQW